VRKVIDKILILQHGQASIERGFSVNKESIQVNQLEDSLIAQRLTYDAIKDQNLTEIQIPKELIRSCRNSSRRYKEKLEQGKAMKDNEDEKAKQLKRIAQEVALKEQEIKKRRLELLAMEDDLMKLNKR